MTINFPRRMGVTATPPVGIEQMLARAPKGHDAVTAALNRLAVAYTSVHATTGLNQRDVTITPAARMVRSARAARRTLTPALDALAHARKAAAESKARLLQKVDSQFDYSGNYTTAMLAGEIRAHFHALSSNQRLASVETAMIAGDATTLKAVGAGPAYLTGLPPAMHAAARDALVDLNPEAKASREAAKSFDEQETFAALLETTVMQSTAELIDFVEADSFAAAAESAVVA